MQMVARSNNRFRYGAGLGDITGPAVGQGNTAYGDTAQVDDGIHIRQFARAFAFQSQCGGRTGSAVIVNVEQGRGTRFRATRGARRPGRRHPRTTSANNYDAHNLMITATHTHSAAWGHSHYDLYNLLTGGFDQEVRDRAVNGVVAAIRPCASQHDRGGAGPIRFGQSELLDGKRESLARGLCVGPGIERPRVRRYGGTRGEHEPA